MNEIEQEQTLTTNIVVQPKTNDAGEITSTTVDETLAERGSRYGSFESHAMLSQSLSQTLLLHYYKTHGKDKPLPPYIVEALNMICHKLARVVNGDPFYDDNFRDIAGYSQLVVDILQTKQEN
jgi:hypothetical protein